MAASEPPRPRGRVATRRLRFAAGLIAAGLAVEGLSLPSATPAAFLTFLIGGVGLVGLGIVVYLVSMIDS